MSKAVKYKVGSKFGQLTIVRRLPKVGSNTKVVCVCDCGNPEELEVFIGNLGKGHTTSCGCAAKVNSRTHGLHSTPAYSTWHHMVDRTTNPENKHFSYYGGGRGIAVCDEWKVSVEAFVRDMGQPEEGESLDRIDTNGDYNKDNCRWAGKGMQAYNQNKRVDNSSGKTGVYLTESGNWTSVIRHNGIKYSLGTYRKFSDAVKAREDAEIKYYGFTKE